MMGYAIKSADEGLDAEKWHIYGQTIDPETDEILYFHKELHSQENFQKQEPWTA